MDGTEREFYSIHDQPDPQDPDPQLGWWSICQVEPAAGWVGPFNTEREAIMVAQDLDAFYDWVEDCVHEEI